MKIRLGSIVNVFDSLEWQKAGRDRGNNSRFYHPARIEKLYKRDGQEMADIRWVASGLRSIGHFTRGFHEHFVVERKVVS